MENVLVALRNLKKTDNRGLISSGILEVRRQEKIIKASLVSSYLSAKFAVPFSPSEGRARHDRMMVKIHRYHLSLCTHGNSAKKGKAILGAPIFAISLFPPDDASFQRVHFPRAEMQRHFRPSSSGGSCKCGNIRQKREIASERECATVAASSFFCLLKFAPSRIFSHR